VQYNCYPVRALVVVRFKDANILTEHPEKLTNGAAMRSHRVPYREARPTYKKPFLPLSGAPTSEVE
jgi:hypothetical protein